MPAVFRKVARELKTRMETLEKEIGTEVKTLKSKIEELSGKVEDVSAGVDEVGEALYRAVTASVDSLVKLALLLVDKGVAKAEELVEALDVERKIAHVGRMYRELFEGEDELSRSLIRVESGIAKPEELKELETALERRVREHEKEGDYVAAALANTLHSLVKLLAKARASQSSGQ